MGGRFFCGSTPESLERELRAVEEIGGDDRPDGWDDVLGDDVDAFLTAQAAVAAERTARLKGGGRDPGKRRVQRPKKPRDYFLRRMGGGRRTLRKSDVPLKDAPTTD